MELQTNYLDTLVGIWFNYQFPIKTNKIVVSQQYQPKTISF